MSQTTLGREVGVSGHQVQNYESGLCRIAAMLYRISLALGLPIALFFVRPRQIRAIAGRANSGAAACSGDRSAAR